MARASPLGDYFFEIPVYRLAEARHRAELEAIKGSVGDALFEFKFREPWEFNEVVGWIALCRFGAQVRKHLYLPKAERIVKRARVAVVKRAELVEDEFAGSPKTSREIFETLLASLERDARRERLLKPRYVDLTSFLAVGPFIDWRALLGLPPT